MVQDEAPQQAEVQQQGQFNPIIIHLQPVDQEVQTHSIKTAPSFTQASPEFLIPRPLSSFEFTELVRANLPSPRHVPVQAFITEIQYDESYSLYSKTFFAGMNDELSNFYPCPLVVADVQFPSLEHAYQYRKALHCNDHELAAKVYRAVTPGETKKQTRVLAQNPLIDSFTKIKFREMAWLLEHKYTQSAVFRSKLKPEVYFCEATTDIFWASGKHKHQVPNNPPIRLEGLNKLGLMLTRLAYRGTLLRDDWCKYV